MRGSLAPILAALALLAGPAVAADAGVPAAAQPVALSMSVGAAIPSSFGIERGTCEREPLEQAARGRPAAQPVPGPSATGIVMALADQLCVAQALEYAPDLRSVRWVGAQGGEWTIAPQETFERDGVYCRTFEASGLVQDQQRQFTNTACRGPDGLWRAAG